MHTIEFQAQHKYSDRESGISVPIELGYGGKSVRLTAKIDTGADFCLFRREYGEMLGIGVEAGERRELRTVNSSLVVYGHEVSLRAMGFDFQLVAYFPEDARVHRSLLGRQGWLSKVRLGVIDYDRLIYLSRYDD